MIFVFVFLTYFVLYNRLSSTAFRLLPCPGYCKQCCNKQWGTCVFLNYGVLRVYAQQQNGWMIWQFLVVVVVFMNLHTVPHSGCINLHSHQQCKRVPFLHILSRIYCLQIFLMMAILISIRRYLIVVLICISLIMSNIENFFHVFVGHQYIFFGEVSVQAFCPVFDWVVCFSDIELRGLLLYFED